MNLTVTKQFGVKKTIIWLGVFLLALFTLFIFDNGLSIGLAMLIFLSCMTFYVLQKLGFKDKKIYVLFLIAIIIRLGATLFMHYADFQPFSGHRGDYSTYQKAAVEFSQEFRQGNFSFKDIDAKYPDSSYMGHYYPAVIGAVYALTLPEEIIGLILNVWLVVISIILVYLIILEIGGLAKNAFIVGLLVTMYPGYVFNTGLLLKDATEICFAILGLLFTIKIIKKFTWYNFLILYLALMGTTHFRFYIGCALIITFLLSWFLLAKVNLKKRLAYGAIFVIILGFIPQIASGQGYYGMKPIKALVNYKMINFYRQSAYNPESSYNKHSSPVISSGLPRIGGLGSSFSVEKGIVGYMKSFTYVLLGPLPWQIKNLRQTSAFLETFPWYLLLFFIVDGAIVLFRRRVKEAAPLIIFSIIVMVVIAIFDSNFGLIVRIRIPAFISLMCLAAFSSKDSMVRKINYLKHVWNIRNLQFKQRIS